MSQSSFAEYFEQNRARLLTLAQRLLGSAAEADDAVQEAWLKISHADQDASDLDSVAAWLTTVVSRTCLDMLRARKTRQGEGAASESEALRDERNPESHMLLADAVGTALFVVIENLPPEERVAFVLHDMFDLPFEDIAQILERSPEAARQSASRARRRVRQTSGASTDVSRQRDLVNAFLTASRSGDLTSLLHILSPDVVMRADAKAILTAAANKQSGAPKLDSEVRGAAQVADVFKGRAAAASLALIDGMPGAVWAMGGQVRSAFIFSFKQGKISEIHLVMDPESLSELEVEKE